MLKKMIKLTNDKGSRFYGFALMATDVPERPETEAFVSMASRTVYINKGAREGANVVRVSYR